MKLRYRETAADRRQGSAATWRSARRFRRRPGRSVRVRRLVRDVWCGGWLVAALIGLPPLLLFVSRVMLANIDVREALADPLTPPVVLLGGAGVGWAVWAWLVYATVADLVDRCRRAASPSSSPAGAAARRGHRPDRQRGVARQHHLRAHQRWRTRRGTAADLRANPRSPTRIDHVGTVHSRRRRAGASAAGLGGVRVSSGAGSCEPNRLGVARRRRVHGQAGRHVVPHRRAVARRR